MTRANVDVERVLSATGSDDEPTRAFLQDRIRLWAFWVFVLAFGFYLVNIATFPFVRKAEMAYADMLLHPANLDHLAASLLFGATWFAMRSRRRFSTPTLRATELVALIGGCALFAMMAVVISRAPWVEGFDAGVGAYAGLLACANTVMARAVTVPSTARRTFIASAIAMAPLIPASIGQGQGAGPVINTISWCAVSIAIAAVGSRVIFGLRTEAARVRRLGQYALEGKIGAGGMGVVYRARHAMLRRPTAIKLLPPDRAGEASIARFEREVQMTSQLSHPNTVSIYDYGRTPDGVFYYAMEYLEGINLEDLVRDHGPQPSGRVVNILQQVCGALNEAHGRGLVHRDIKPPNIILTERGGEPDVAKVVDFGLVKRLSTTDPQLTMSAPTVLAGSPLYMAPEALKQPEGGDPRSDLYALGAVGYYLLTGQRVFEAQTIAEVIGRHLYAEPVPPSQRVTFAIPSDLETLILQCLHKRPEDRPQTAQALREALVRCRDLAPWTRDDAVRWWERLRSAHRPPPSEERTTLEELTVTVSVEGRT